ncbi:hypothetical protein HU200_008705 [Digitaria exilis]|uniref:Omega-hydroxypalmitate O-feruloyl transferase n=1 Tax=Digitaria exilis TaxID=1010633 RepID=A0A835KNR1_9POAL|nr:hypothetical protein HU200_008705 [Digitaria exilis]
MASVNPCSDWQVRVVSRRLVKASDTSIMPRVVNVSNLDRIAWIIQVSMFCVYAKPAPPTGDFAAVVAAFEVGLPSFLNHFFLLAGRIATANTSSGIPEIHCRNQGAELVVAKAGVALGSLDYRAMGPLLERIQLPYGEDMALSVQVVSFACGGFTVAWRTNHVLLDGCALSSLVTAWSEFTRSDGTLPASHRPNHDRSVFHPRTPPSYSATLDEAFTLLDSRHLVNALTADQSSVLRFYYIEAADIARLREAASRGGDGERATRVEAVSAYLWKTLAGVVGAADPRCRMGWWVNGRRRLTSPDLRCAMRNYLGNFITFAGKEATVQEVVQMPLPEVASMVREAITAPAYEEHFQELVDWVEGCKDEPFLSASIGLGSLTLIVTAFTSFRIDTDFGFGQAVMAVPTDVRTAVTMRLCSGYVQIVERPGGGEGSWIVSAFVWPQLAAALEADEPRVFEPLTAEQLGLFAPHCPQSRL